MSLIELTPAEAERLGCSFLLEVPCPLDYPEPEFIYDSESLVWVRNSDFGRPRACKASVSYARRADKGSVRDFKAHRYESLKAENAMLWALLRAARDKLDAALTHGGSP